MKYFVKTQTLRRDEKLDEQRILEVIVVSKFQTECGLENQFPIFEEICEKGARSGWSD